MKNMNKLASSSSLSSAGTFKKERRGAGSNNLSATMSSSTMSLMSGLRPKVYITDTSSFKSLVQQLTGNNAISGLTTTSSGSGTLVRSSSTSSVSYLSPPRLSEFEECMERVPVLVEKETTSTSNNNNNNSNGGDPYYVDYGYNNYATAGGGGESSTSKMMEMMMNNNNNNNNEDEILMMEDGENIMGEGMDLLAYKVLESWLLDMDHQHPTTTANQLQ